MFFEANEEWRIHKSDRTANSLSYEFKYFIDLTIRAKLIQIDDQWKFFLSGCSLCLRFRSDNFNKIMKNKWILSWPRFLCNFSSTFSFFSTEQILQYLYMSELFEGEVFNFEEKKNNMCVSHAFYIIRIFKLVKWPLLMNISFFSSFKQALKALRRLKVNDDRTSEFVLEENSSVKKILLCRILPILQFSHHLLCVYLLTWIELETFFYSDESVIWTF